MEEVKSEVNVIELKSTLRGLSGLIAAKIFWFIMFLVAGIFVLEWAHRTMAVAIAASQKEGYAYLFSSPSKADAYFVYTLTFILFAAALFILFVAIADLYKAHEVNLVYLKEGKIICTAYSFPFQKVVRQVQFNRIMRADVHQKSFDRVFGTGTLGLELITYTNADAETTVWGIPHIIDPDSARETIMSAMPEYTGLLIRTS